MSSIHLNGKNPGPIDPTLDGVAAAPTDAGAPGSGQTSANPAVVEALAAMGLTPTSSEKVDRADPSNRFEAGHAITSQPPPLPQDRAPVTPQTQALFQSLSQEMDVALNMAQPPTADVDAAGSQAPGNTMLRQLSQVSETEAQTPAGQQKISTIVTDGLKAGALDMGAVSNSGMMAAFMVLQVQNKAAGKELTGVLLNLTAESRKASLDDQIKLNTDAAAKVKEAAEKQKKLAFLGPLIEVIMALVMVAITVLTAGSMTAICAMAIGAVIGFVAGGAVGGAQKGTGFDVVAGLSGMAMGASVGGLVSKALLVAVEKIALMMVKRGISSAAGALGKQAGSMAAKAGTSNMSSMAIIGAGIAVETAGTVTKAALTYDYEKTTADAKELQAKAKMQKALSEMMQNQYQALSGSLQGMLTMHNTAVNQVLSMLKTQFGAMQKAIAQING